MAAKFLLPDEITTVFEIVESIKCQIIAGNSVSCYELIAHLLIRAIIAKEFGDTSAYNDSMVTCRVVCSYSAQNVQFDKKTCQAHFQTAFNMFSDAIIDDTRIFKTNNFRRVPFILYIDTIVKKEMEKMIQSPSHFDIQY